MSESSLLPDRQSVGGHSAIHRIPVHSGHRFPNAFLPRFRLLERKMEEDPKKVTEMIESLREDIESRVKHGKNVGLVVFIFQPL